MNSVKIEHAAMYVNDLEAARDFFVRYLGGRSNDGYHNKTTGFRSYFISFDDGARLEIMTRPELCDPDKEPNRTGYAHIAFSVGSRDRVIGIAADGTAVGLALVRDLDGEPACYDLQQFMIDRRFQGRGYGPDAPDSLNLVYRF